MGEALKGDYLGFTYNGRHSSEFGIVRTSNGSRFDENLLPTMQDKTVQVQGGDGAYYFGSQYTQRVFNVSFAFDSMDEQKLEQLRRHFGDKKIHDLIFDERPYKIYSAKVTGTATLKYIPFEEGETGRLYKGEGSITFTCYNPFARSRYKFLEEYNDADFPNKNEWAAASGMPQKKEDYDKIDEDGDFALYNAGDICVDFALVIPFHGPTSSIPEGFFEMGDERLAWEKISRKVPDIGIYIDTKTNLIYGYKMVGSQKVKTDNIYNEYITSGNFFKIPLRDSFLTISESLSSLRDRIEIKYDYYYL